MGKMNIEIVPGYHYKKLTTKWYWDTAHGRVWKCSCQCGAACYVRESALQLHIVGGCESCEAETLQTKKDYRETLPKYKKRKKPLKNKAIFGKLILG